MTKKQKKCMALAREALITADIDPQRVDDIIEWQFKHKVSDKLKEWAFNEFADMDQRRGILDSR